MRLRFVTTCSFQKSEHTNFREVIKKRPEFGDPEHEYRLKSEDVVLLVSMTGNQLVFLHGFDYVDSGAGKKTIKVLRSTKYRITDRARWDPLLLAAYAASIGITLVGLKAYEDHIKAINKKG